jgi:hypothetical protein
MRTGNSCGRTVNRFVIRLIDWVTIVRQGNRRLLASPLRRRPRRPPALWLAGMNVLALSVTTAAVVLSSAAVSLAPMWDRAIFVKSLLEALNTNPALLQGL